MKKVVRNALHAVGIDVVRHRSPSDPANIPSDIPAADRAIMERIVGCTMTSAERQAALIQAVRYVVKRGLPGDYVECGV